MPPHHCVAPRRRRALTTSPLLKCGASRGCSRGYDSRHHSLTISSVASLTGHRMRSCDEAGTVRYWNAAAERVFGFRVAEALGASMNVIIPERFRARHWAGWDETMRTGVTRYGEGQLLAVPAITKTAGRFDRSRFS